MRYVEINAVEPGQVLGRAIMSSNGAVLIAENVELTVYMVNTLKRIGVSFVYIQDEDYADVEVKDLVSDETRQNIVNRMNETLQSINSGRGLSSKEIAGTLTPLIEEVMANQDVLIHLTDIRTFENEMFSHAVNVCTMSVLIGLKMQLNQYQLKELAIGALLHDIGKISGAKEVVHDSSTHHTWQGYYALKQSHDISLVSAHVALQHHETPDGQGSPRGLKDDQIHPYARIVSVANRYDNLIYARDPEERLLPHEAYELMAAQSGSKYDYEVMKQFMQSIALYPNGTSVRLTTKESGVVVRQHRGLPTRPVVRVVEKDVGGHLEVSEIDLAKRTTVFIDRVYL